MHINISSSFMINKFTLLSCQFCSNIITMASSKNDYQQYSIDLFEQDFRKTLENKPYKHKHFETVDNCVFQGCNN